MPVHTTRSQACCIILRLGELMYRPLLGFDTSGINALNKRGTAAEHLIAGLDAAYAVRLNGTALDEIVAHSLPGERERLRRLCRRLLANGEGDVLLPFHEITTGLALAFESGEPFNWTRVDVRSSEYMDFIFGGEILDLDAVSVEQRRSAVETDEQFERLFLNPRTIFQKLRETDKKSWPKSAVRADTDVAGSRRRVLGFRHGPIHKGDEEIRY